MNCQTKIDEFLDKIEKDKLLMETQFANIETIIKENEEIDYENLVNLLSTFNTTNIKYEQLCNDLTLFISLFKPKEEQEIRIYKTEELIDLFEKEISKMEK
ncbi:hypothetical protein [uncultured Methanobrevibacter sp.]|uniref:hypothetical protein n=1 Tax=uncultured Methanobrevibacter sp. TaxID=253161 RepID=UPI0015BC1299|nr:hypothetical protein [uncultured Methanobrevibacter sp.]